MSQSVSALVAAAAAVVLLTLADTGAAVRSAETRTFVNYEHAVLANTLAGVITSRQKAQARGREAECRRQLSRTLRLLDKQPHLLIAGSEQFLASLDSYSESTRAIEVELDRIPRASSGRQCTDALNALTDAADLHSGVVQDWSDCVFERGSICGSIMSLCALGDGPSDICADRDVDLDDTGELSMSIMRLTAVIARGDWKKAARKLETSKQLVVANGTTTRPDSAVPRSPSKVDGSVYGQTVGVLCAGSGVPSDAEESCRSLRDLLVQGVSTEEDADLNEALTGIVEAYQLPVREN